MHGYVCVCVADHKKGLKGIFTDRDTFTPVQLHTQLSQLYNAMYTWLCIPAHVLVGDLSRLNKHNYCADRLGTIPFMRSSLFGIESIDCISIQF